MFMLLLWLKIFINVTKHFDTNLCFLTILCLKSCRRSWEENYEVCEASKTSYSGNFRQLWSLQDESQCWRTTSEAYKEFTFMWWLWIWNYSRVLFDVHVIIPYKNTIKAELQMKHRHQSKNEPLHLSLERFPKTNFW